jgi:hypothetical protein
MRFSITDRTHVTPPVRVAPPKPGMACQDSETEAAKERDAFRHRVDEPIPNNQSRATPAARHRGQSHAGSILRQRLRPVPPWRKQWSEQLRARPNSPALGRSESMNERGNRGETTEHAGTRSGVGPVDLTSTPAPKPMPNRPRIAIAEMPSSQGWLFCRDARRTANAAIRRKKTTVIRSGCTASSPRRLLKYTG